MGDEPERGVEHLRQVHSPGHLSGVFDHEPHAIAAIAVTHARRLARYCIANAHHRSAEPPAVELTRVQHILSRHLKPRIHVGDGAVVGPLPPGGVTAPDKVGFLPGGAVIDRSAQAAEQGVLCPDGRDQIQLEQVFGHLRAGVHAQHVFAIDRDHRGEVLGASKAPCLFVALEDQVGVLRLGHHSRDESGRVAVDAGRGDRLDPELALAIKSRGQRVAGGLDLSHKQRCIPCRPFSQLVAHHLGLWVGLPAKLQPVGRLHDIELAHRGRGQQGQHKGCDMRAVLARGVISADVVRVLPCRILVVDHLGAGGFGDQSGVVPARPDPHLITCQVGIGQFVPAQQQIGHAPLHGKAGHIRRRQCLAQHRGAECGGHTFFTGDADGP